MGNVYFQLFSFQLWINLAQSTKTVDWTDCISAECKMPTNDCPWFEIRQSDGEAPVVLEFWGMGITPSLPFYPGPFWTEVVAPDSVLPVV